MSLSPNQATVLGLILFVLFTAGGGLLGGWISSTFHFNLDLCCFLSIMGAEVTFIGVCCLLDRVCPVATRKGSVQTA